MVQRNYIIKYFIRHLHFSYFILSDLNNNICQHIYTYYYIYIIKAA